MTKGRTWQPFKPVLLTIYGNRIRNEYLEVCVVSQLSSGFDYVFRKSTTQKSSTKIPLGCHISISKECLKKLTWVPPQRFQGT